LGVPPHPLSHFLSARRPVCSAAHARILAQQRIGGAALFFYTCLTQHAFRQATARNERATSAFLASGKGLSFSPRVRLIMSAARTSCARRFIRAFPQGTKDQL